MSKSEWKLRFDPKKFEVVLPPESLRTIHRMIGDGPNMQLIEHCHFADTMDNLHARAPIFHMRVPICNKGESREWPMGRWPKCEVGQHLKIKLPIAILSSERKSDHKFDFIGSIKVSHPDELGSWVHVDILQYSELNREGSISMPRASYIRIVELWQQHFFETS